MSFKATLFIFDKQYPLVDAKHSLKQHVDISGRPTSKVLGGTLELLFVPTSDDTALLEAMISPTQMVKGYIRVYKRDGMSKDFDIEFANAFVILLTHSFNAENSDPFIVETHISPQIQRSRDTIFELSANPSNPFIAQTPATVREEREEEQKKKPKYKFYNVLPTGTRVHLNLDQGMFTAITGYGSDPSNLKKVKLNAYHELFKNLPAKNKVVILKKLKIPKKLWGKIAKAPSLASFATALMEAQEDGFDALPIFGLIVTSYSDDFKEQGRIIENDIKWEAVRESYKSIIELDDLEDVILIYTDELITDQSTIDASEVEYLDDRYSYENYKYCYYGSQWGDTLFIFGKYTIN